MFIVVCISPLNGQVDCDKGLVNNGFEGENCTFMCNPGYSLMQENVTNGTCENNGNWSNGLPSCVPLRCGRNNGCILRRNATLSQSCSRQYLSECTVSCNEGFVGDDVTYLCNVTNNPNRSVNWMPIGSAIVCERERGLLIPKIMLSLRI